MKRTAAGGGGGLGARLGLTDRIDLPTDVDDHEKPALMAGAAASTLPSRPQPEFVETFGIALVETMLTGGGPVITCATGGILEEVGDTALIVPTHDPDAIRASLDTTVCDWSREDRHAAQARPTATRCAWTARRLRRLVRPDHPPAGGG